MLRKKGGEMEILAKGVKTLKRATKQSQEEFKDDVCVEYNEFLEDFIIDGGAYYEMYHTLCNNYATPQDKVRAERLESRVISAVAREINKAVEIACKNKEAPVVDSRYYRDLYRKYEASNKSSEIIQQLTDEIYLAINALVRQIELEYDKFFPENHNSSVKLLRKTSDLTQVTFKENVCRECRMFMEEFLIKGGAYCDMYQTICNFETQQGEKLDKTLDEKTKSFCSANMNRIVEMAKLRDVVPCPNNGFYRALYRKFQASNKSPKAIKQIKDEFTTSLDAILREVDAAYDEFKKNNN